jgi:endonuclease G, mitochondrial
MSDNSSLLPVSASIAHFLEFFCLHGAPANSQTNPPVQVIVNHGYALGFCPDRGQPLWAAYQVAAAVRDLDFQRPEFFYDDPRLPEAWRIGTQGYARVAGKTYDRGHMVPNFAINTQFGRVAQFETFLMSNIVPQRHALNAGVWKQMEMNVATSYPARFGEVWVIVGPVFGSRAEKLRNGTVVPEAFFKIVIDESDGRVRAQAFIFPQETPAGAEAGGYLVSIDEIEQRTGLDFLPELPDTAEDALEAKRAERVW